MGWADAVANARATIARTFKTAATFRQTKTGDEYSISGIFNNPGVNLAVGNDVEVLTQHPTFWVDPAGLLFVAERGDRLTVNGSKYMVLEVKPDANGGQYWELKK